jgi:hypothetical protein
LHRLAANAQGHRRLDQRDALTPVPQRAGSSDAIVRNNCRPKAAPPGAAALHFFARGGPLPKGWEANQLTYEQIRDIMANIPTYENRLAELGWRPFGLPVTGAGNSIKNILDQDIHHERSPMGLRFRSLGGEAALARFGDFETATGLTLPRPDPNKWPSKITALEGALGLAQSLEKSTGVAQLRTDMAKAKKLLGKMEAAIELVGKGGDDATNAKKDGEALKTAPLLFGDDALTHFNYTGNKTVAEGKAFLEIKKGELDGRAADLRNLGHDPTKLTLVAQAKLLAKLDKLNGATDVGGLVRMLGTDCADVIPSASVRAGLTGAGAFFKLPTALKPASDWAAVAKQLQPYIALADKAKAAAKEVKQGGLSGKITSLLLTPMKDRIDVLKASDVYTGFKADLDDIAAGADLVETAKAQQVVTDKYFFPTWDMASKEAETNFKLAVNQWMQTTKTDKPGIKPGEDFNVYLQRRLAEIGLDTGTTFGKHFDFPPTFVQALKKHDAVGSETTKGELKKELAGCVGSVQAAWSRWGAAGNGFCKPLLQALKNVAGSLK